jgi:peptidyl-tRNA hydrolase
MRAFYIIRKDLNLSPAKLAVQVGHGTCLIYNSHELSDAIKRWNKNNMKKIVVSVDNETKMNNIWDKLSRDKYFSHMIFDLGLTELSGFTYTGIVLLVAENDIPNYIRRLRLYE